MNRQTLQLKRGKNYAELMLIGDVHIGSPECDEQKFRNQLEYCRRVNRSVFLMGDYLEASTRHSVGAGVYEQARSNYPTIQHQYDRVVDLLRPLADAGLIKGAHSGNHEDRVYVQTGYDVTKQLCKDLHIPYMGAAGWTRFSVGTKKYMMYSLHGSSGSKYVYTKLKSLVDISHSFDADILACGHVHSCADTYQIVQKYDRHCGVVKDHKKLIVITGHYLKYGGYGAAKGYPVEKMGSPLIHLHSDRHETGVSW